MAESVMDKMDEISKPTGDLPEIPNVKPLNDRII